MGILYKVKGFAAIDKIDKKVYNVKKNKKVERIVFKKTSYSNSGKTRYDSVVIRIFYGDLPRNPYQEHFGRNVEVYQKVISSNEKMLDQKVDPYKNFRLQKLDVENFSNEFASLEKEILSRKEKVQKEKIQKEAAEEIKAFKLEEEKKFLALAWELPISLEKKDTLNEEEIIREVLPNAGEVLGSVVSDSDYITHYLLTENGYAIDVHINEYNASSNMWKSTIKYKKGVTEEITAEFDGSEGSGDVVKKIIAGYKQIRFKGDAIFAYKKENCFLLYRGDNLLGNDGDYNFYEVVFLKITF